jgi:hypothetical protein
MSGTNFGGLTVATWVEDMDNMGTVDGFSIFLWTIWTSWTYVYALEGFTSWLWIE